MSKSKFTPEEKASIAQEYLDGIGSSIELAKNIMLIIILFVDGHIDMREMDC